MPERVDLLSRLFLTEIINAVLDNCGQIHLLFFESTPFSGEVGGGGVLSAFSKAKLRFPFSLYCRQCGTRKHVKKADVK